MSKDVDTANERFLQAAVAIDPEETRASLLAGASLVGLEKSTDGLVVFLVYSLEAALQNLNHDHTRVYGASGFLEANLVQTLESQNKALQERMTALIHTVFKHASKEDAHLLATSTAQMGGIFQLAHAGLGESLSELVKHGANPDARTRMNATPLHWAAQEGRLGCIKRLAGFGVPLNVQNQQGETPAHAAAKNQNVLVLRELKRLGADFSLTNTSGETAAETLGKRDMAMRLQWESWEKHHEATLRAKQLERSLAKASPEPEGTKRRRIRM